MNRVIPGVGSSLIQTDRPAPLWIGSDYVVIERYGERRRATGEPIVYDSWARQRAAVREFRFETWLPGVTDRSDNFDIWQELDAQVHFRFKGEDEFHSAYVDFEQFVGNNAQYGLKLQRFDPWFAPYHSETEVAGIHPDIVEGPDHMRGAEMEFYITLNGVPFQDEPGKNFRAFFEGEGPLP